jgi:hypothetical protein
MALRRRLSLLAAAGACALVATIAPATQAVADVGINQVSCGNVYYGATGKSSLEHNACLGPQAYLETSYYLHEGHYQKLTFVYQSDGNLVLYRWISGQGYGTAIWASNTNGRSAGLAALQTDGNFVLYNSSGQAYWATGTWNCAGSWSYHQLDVQTDENVVLYFWPSNGGGKVAKWDRWGLAHC